MAEEKPEILTTTFDGYIKNPAILGNATFQYKFIEESYSHRFDKTLMREGGSLQYFLYVDKDGNRYLHMKVPSEAVPNFFYDVVIEFVSSTLTTVLPTLGKNDIKFFSNDPAFVYTYAYAFNIHGLLIDSLKNKLPKECLKSRAVVKNPNANIGNVKSFYFCYFYARLKDLMYKIKWTALEQKLKADTFKTTIQHASDKIADRQRLANTAEKPISTRGGIKYINKQPGVKRVRKAKQVKFANAVNRNKKLHKPKK